MDRKINNTLFMYKEKLEESEQLELYTMLYDQYDSDYLSGLFFDTDDNLLKKSISTILGLRKNEDDMLFFINTVFDEDREIRLNSLMYLREMGLFKKDVSLLDDFIENEKDKNLINIAKYLRQDLEVDGLVKKTEPEEDVKEDFKVMTVEEHVEKSVLNKGKIVSNKENSSDEDGFDDDIYQFVKENIDTDDMVVLMNLSFKIKNARIPSKKDFILNLLRRVDNHAVIRNLLLGLNTEEISQPFRKEVCRILSGKTFFNELEYDLKMLKFYEVNEFMGNPQRPGFLKRCALFMLNTFGI